MSHCYYGAIPKEIGFASCYLSGEETLTENQTPSHVACFECKPKLVEVDHRMNYRKSSGLFQAPPKKTCWGAKSQI